MKTTILRTESLVKRYGGILVTNDVSLGIDAGEIHAIIGPNGAGKTTLVSQLSGELAPSEGRIIFCGEDVTSLPIYKRARRGLLRSYQITSVFEAFTVKENAVLCAMGTTEHSFRFWRSMLDRKQAVLAADEALEAAGLARLADVPVAALGYGERRELELAMALAARPKLLLLDEPMAGMSPHESLAVVSLLRRLKGRYSILLIEHDMDAVFALADRITVLANGKVICTGTPAEIRENPQIKDIYLGNEELPVVGRGQ
ncbi:ABC transporter ATP-binding protein [Caballeronia sp. KNU42]